MTESRINPHDDEPDRRQDAPTPDPRKRSRSEHQRDVRRYRAGARHPNGRGL